MHLICEDRNDKFGTTLMTLGFTVEKYFHYIQNIYEEVCLHIALSKA
jgi:hypothetical protein